MIIKSVLLYIVVLLLINPVSSIFLNLLPMPYIATPYTLYSLPCTSLSYKPSPNPIIDLPYHPFFLPFTIYTSYYYCYISSHYLLDFILYILHNESLYPALLTITPLSCKPTHDPILNQTHLTSLSSYPFR